MSLSHALGVDGAGEAAAHGHALQHAERIGSAGFRGVAIVVGNTVWDRGLLAGREYWIPFVSILTLAGGMARDYVRLTLLVRPTDHLATRVHALVGAIVEDQAERAFLTVGVAGAAGFYA